MTPLRRAHADVTTTIRLEVPARAAFLRLLRLTAAAAVADAAIPLERVDDVRLAVDELAASVIAATPPGETLRVDIEARPGELSVEGRVRAGPRAPALSTVGRQLLATTCREHQLGRDRGDLVFRVAVDLAAGR